LLAENLPLEGSSAKHWLPWMVSESIGGRKEGKTQWAAEK